MFRIGTGSTLPRTGQSVYQILNREKMGDSVL